MGLHIQLLKDSSGTLISSYSANSTNTITTEGIDTSNYTGQAGLLLVLNGTVANLTRQVSIDNSTFYDVYDNLGNKLIYISSSPIPSSRYIMFENLSCNEVISPYTRFQFIGSGTVTTVTAYYIQTEE